VDLAIEHRNADRCARALREQTPSVAGGIVFERSGAGALVHRRREAAEGVDLRGISVP
jgi:hypothetical protein